MQYSNDKYQCVIVYLKRIELFAYCFYITMIMIILLINYKIACIMLILINT